MLTNSGIKWSQITEFVFLLLSTRYLRLLPIDKEWTEFTPASLPQPPSCNSCPIFPPCNRRRCTSLLFTRNYFATPVAVTTECGSVCECLCSQTRSSLLPDSFVSAPRFGCVSSQIRSSLLPCALTNIGIGARLWGGGYKSCEKLCRRFSGF